MTKRKGLLAAGLGAFVLVILSLRAHRHSLRKAQPVQIMLLDGTAHGRTRQVWLCRCGEAVTFTSGKSWITFRSDPEPEGS